MTSLKRYSTILAALTLALVFLIDANAGGKTGSASVIMAKATATKPATDGTQTVTITLDIEKGWHIYANPINTNADTLRGNATKVTIAAKAPIKAKVEYPKGKLKVDGDSRFDIYENRAVIQAQVQRAAGDTSPLKISINVNACDKNNCLPPSTIVVNVP